jgi:hypothetical protein
VLACENENGEVEAVLPLLGTRGLPFTVESQQLGRRWSSLPRTPTAGPVFTSQDSGLALLQAASEWAGRSRGMQLQIKSQLQFPKELLNDLTFIAWRPTYVLEIPGSKEDLRFGDAHNRHNLKWAVKKAEKLGLRLRLADNETDLHAWYSLYLQTMRRNSVPPRPLCLFVAMWRNLVAQGLMRLQLAEQQESGSRRLVAGSIFLTFGDTTWYAFTGIGDKDFALHANDLILWHTINESCGTDVHWFDFGEVAEDHPELARFKTKWGARPKEQYRYLSVGPRSSHGNDWKLPGILMRIVRRIWRRVPIKVTAQLGDWIYSRL